MEIIENSPDVVLINSKVFIKTTRPTMAIGLEDMIAVETENGTLIADEKQFEGTREGLEKIDQLGILETFY